MGVEVKTMAMVPQARQYDAVPTLALERHKARGPGERTTVGGNQSGRATVCVCLRPRRGQGDEGERHEGLWNRSGRQNACAEQPAEAGEHRYFV